MNQNLCIDIGNTLIKAAVFEGYELKEKKVFENHEALISWFLDKNFSNVIISSVRANEPEIQNAFSASHIVMFNPGLSIPVKNSYRTPQTLGKDRLASVVGATSVFPGQNCLVIDAGTCITFDLITSEGEYLGGAISPGLLMRFKALNYFTAKLPLLTPEMNTPVVGYDTGSSIRSGVQNGMVYEIQGVIEKYGQLYPGLIVILCGGDSSFFESKIKGTIFAFPDLVLIGLNHSLLYNAPK